jgi:hypothetical protein
VQVLVALRFFEGGQLQEIVEPQALAPLAHCHIYRDFSDRELSSWANNNYEAERTRIDPEYHKDAAMQCESKCCAAVRSQERAHEF